MYKCRTNRFRAAFRSGALLSHDRLLGLVLGHIAEIAQYGGLVLGGNIQALQELAVRLRPGLFL